MKLWKSSQHSQHPHLSHWKSTTLRLKIRSFSTWNIFIFIFHVAFPSVAWQLFWCEHEDSSSTRHKLCFPRRWWWYWSSCLHTENTLKTQNSFSPLSQRAKNRAGKFSVEQNANFSNFKFISYLFHFNGMLIFKTENKKKKREIKLKKYKTRVK